MGGVQSTTISEDWNIINLVSEPKGMAIVPADEYEEYVWTYQEDKAEEARLQTLEARWADLPTQVQQISEPECMAIVPVNEEYVWIYQEDNAAEDRLQTLEARWTDLPTQVQQISDTLSLSRSQFDPHHYDSKMTELLSSEGQDFFTTYDEVHYSFDTMGLSENLKKGIYGYGFDVPSAIQQKGIVPFSKGLDVIQQAQSGTGKTATFCCGVLARLDYNRVQCQALVLAPTRELVQHIERLMRELGDYLCVKVHACVGDRDQQILQNHAHVVVGTPGRVFDMLRRRSLRTDLIRMLVLDEADEILSRNVDQIHDIFEMLPSKVQVGMFSTTMPPEALEMTRRFTTKPVRFLVKRDELALEDIEQFHVNVGEEDWKVESVCDIHKYVEGEWLIIFVNSCQKTDWLAREMRARGCIVSASHQDMDEATREVNFSEFRSGSTPILITTDLLARGIDLPHVSLVINYDLPTRPESYIHRIGRTGRFERKGVAINFITRADERMFFDIQRFYNVVIEELPSNFSDLLW